MTSLPPAPFSRRCLLIEDDRHAAECLGALLELEGFEVETALDGHRGLALARELRPAAVLCDIALPGALDGLAVARACRASPELAGTVLIGLSGYGDEEDFARAYQAGFDHYLVKPVQLESIRSALLAGRRRTA